MKLIADSCGWIANEKLMVVEGTIYAICSL